MGTGFDDVQTSAFVVGLQTSVVANTSIDDFAKNLVCILLEYTGQEREVIQNKDKGVYRA